MARQSRTIDKPAAISGSEPARVLAQLDRMVNFVREGARVARAAASVAMTAGHRWQLPAHAAFLTYDHTSATGFVANDETRAVRSQSRLDDGADQSGRNGERKTASVAQLIRPTATSVMALKAAARVSHSIGKNEAATSMVRLKDSDGAINGELGGTRGGHANAWPRTTARVDAGGRWFREISLARDALSRVERSVESGSAAGAISTAGRRATESGLKSSIDFAGQAQRANEVAETMVVANAKSLFRSDAGQVSSRSRESLEAQRTAFAKTGFLASARMASSIYAVIPPVNFSQREFAELSGNAGGSNNSSVRTGITINSSPTVVINAPAAGGNVERDAIGALRAHREELFNQLQRELARRERAQF